MNYPPKTNQAYQTSAHSQQQNHPIFHLWKKLIYLFFKGVDGHTKVDFSSTDNKAL